MSLNFEDQGGKSVVQNIEELTLQNSNYRTTIWTGKKLQVTVMSIEPGDDIGLEIHQGIDQFLRIESGNGVCKMGPEKDNCLLSKK